jgi:hypothetical protein
LRATVLEVGGTSSNKKSANLRKVLVPIGSGICLLKDFASDSMTPTVIDLLEEVWIYLLTNHHV